jgi:hypothetical protein
MAVAASSSDIVVQIVFMAVRPSSRIVSVNDPTAIYAKDDGACARALMSLKADALRDADACMRCREDT